MRDTLLNLIDRLSDPTLSEANVIPWSCPVPSFGDLTRSKIATLGINPSNKEFIDSHGRELDGKLRRFHTLKSLGLKRWSNAKERHLQLITDACCNYFYRNPYNGWFQALENIISGTNSSYYGTSNTACHLDLIPYATLRKWTDLTTRQRTSLMELSGDTLALLLENSPIRVLILNGRAVVEHMQSVSSNEFEKREINSWALPRASGHSVKGYAYKGYIREISGIRLKRDIKILGFNHNIQSSFGVTTKVKSSIKQWVTRNTKEVIS